MGCSYCHGNGHNIRTCNYDLLVQIVARVAWYESCGCSAKQAVYRAIDERLPGLGVSAQIAEVIYHHWKNTDKYAGRNKRILDAIDSMYNDGDEYLEILTQTTDINDVFNYFGY